MRGLERPPAVSATLALDQVDRLVQARVGSAASGPEVVEAPEHVIEPPVRKREKRPRGVGELPGGEAAEHPSFEKILFGALAACSDFGGCSRGAFVLQQAFEHADGGVERGAGGTEFDVAVPSAVVELLGEEPVDDAVHVFAEGVADRDDHPVDAGLDFAVEVGLAGVVPGDVIADSSDRIARFGARRVGAERTEEHEGVVGAGPGLPGVVGFAALGGVVDAAVPQAGGPLQGEDLAAPPLGRDPCPLSVDELVGRIEKVTHHLPADRRVRIEQPIGHSHAGEFRGAVASSGRAALRPVAAVDRPRNSAVRGTFARSPPP